MADNAAENARRAEACHEAVDVWLSRRWLRGPTPAPPAVLPEGPLLPRVQGIFLVRRGYGYAVVQGVWEDRQSNPGDSSAIAAVALDAGLYCGLEPFALEDAAFLGVAATQEIHALNESLMAVVEGPSILYFSQVQITRRPGSGMFWRAYPAAALEQAVVRESAVLCTISQGRMAACEVASEEPLGHGLGIAAKTLAPEGFQVGPMLTDRAPSEGRRLCLPIAFCLME